MHRKRVTCSALNNPIYCKTMKYNITGVVFKHGPVKSLQPRGKGSPHTTSMPRLSVVLSLEKLAMQDYVSSSTIPCRDPTIFLVLLLK